MPENIFKVYRPQPNTEKDKDKKSRGLWYDDKEEDRFEHIKVALSRYCDNDKDYDYLDLVWHIKNAVIGGVYISEKVYEGIKAPDGIWRKYVKIENNEVRYGDDNKKTDQYEIISDIINGNAVIKDGVFDDKYLEIRKWTGKKEAGTEDSLIFEHVIPAKVYIQELIRAYTAKEFDLKYFRTFRENILICIVTKEENDRLNKWKNSMPILKGKEVLQKEDWLNVTKNKLDRYKNVTPAVRIHGLK